MWPTTPPVWNLSDRAFTGRCRSFSGNIFGQTGDILMARIGGRCRWLMRLMSG